MVSLVRRLVWAPGDGQVIIQSMCNVRILGNTEQHTFDSHDVDCRTVEAGFLTYSVRGSTRVTDFTSRSVAFTPKQTGTRRHYY